MFRNLNAEMTRRGLTRQELAKRMGICTNTLSRKLNGLRSFTLEELNEIRDIPNEIMELKLDLDVLFEKSENPEPTTKKGSNYGNSN